MIRIGILGAADIAKRRFLPALLNLRDEYELAGVASATNDERLTPLKEIDAEEKYIPADDKERMDKVKALLEEHLAEYKNAKAYESYEALLEDDSVDAVYIPLPPALHYYWGKKALENGKHVFMEKPLTVSYELTRELVSLAEEKKLALFENYGFTFNDQVKVMENVMNDKEKFGDLRLLRSYFGFPKRKDSDFRYDKKLGGGALLDCGGYTIKIARHFLGDDLTVLSVVSSRMPDHDVDGWDSVMMVSKQGIAAQLAFGMDNQYKCDAELWGSRGCVSSPRIFTAPPAFVPKLTFSDMSGNAQIEAECGDAFLNAQKLFAKCVSDERARDDEYWEIVIQAKLVNEVMKLI